MLNTPIKKIRNLRLLLPRLPLLPVRYPSMSDLPGPQNGMFENMVDKGYSQTFSSSVLQELDLRAQEISGQIEPLPERRERRKRYLGAHKPMFQKMESISSHYAASRNRPAGQGSATKKRRTLNGPEEVFGKENELPLRRKNEKEHSEKPEKLLLSQGPTLAPPAPYQLRIWSPRLNRTHGSASPERSGAQNESNLKTGTFPPRSFESPTRSANSPERESRENSPSRATRISPSKGHMNLNSLLGDNMDTEEPQEVVFTKPLPKQRQSSLQLAGVAPGFQKKPSLTNLHPPTPQNAHSFKTSSLQKKTSIPTLQKRPSIPNLQKKPSIPNLQKKPSVPSLQKKPLSSLLRQPLSNQTLNKKESMSNLQKPTSLLKKPSNASLKPSGSRNFTIPQPFSLYDRPTVLSSQKALSKENGRSPSERSLNSMKSDVSQRSLSKFQKFKSRFA